MKSISTIFISGVHSFGTIFLQKSFSNNTDFVVCSCCIMHNSFCTSYYPHPSSTTSSEYTPIHITFRRLLFVPRLLALFVVFSWGIQGILPAQTYRAECFHVVRFGREKFLFRQDGLPSDWAMILVRLV